jgi:S-methylmethionine-dependent homocysteine/selenocysteine methylase
MTHHLPISIDSSAALLVTLVRPGCFWNITDGDKLMRIRTDKLPQLSGNLFLTDGGIETTLIYHERIDLPYFAAFDLLRQQAGREVLRRYYRTYVEIARTHDLGFILESPTWRASPDWGRKLGYSADALADANRAAIALLEEIRDEFANPEFPVVVSGCVGPRGDGYVAGEIMSVDEAVRYHRRQVGTFAASAVDMVTAITMTNVPESIGIALAAQSEDVPVVISFTVETDGRLPTGDTIGDAVRQVDAATGHGPAYYMINCAHPTHFAQELSGDGDWLHRICGLRANASCLSHAELDAAEELDDGNPREFGAQHRLLKEQLPNLVVFGGCCGTDHRHIAAIGAACAPGAVAG